MFVFVKYDNLKYQINKRRRREKKNEIGLLETSHTQTTIVTQATSQTQQK